MNILIVDDRDDNRYLLESLLKGNGHQVTSAVNGVEALEILKSERIDLIISDILMPVMDGFQLCRTVKTDPALRNIPLIIYTATYTGSQDEAFAVKIGANRFIEKPCEPDVFLAAVNEVMAGAGHQGNVSFDPPVEEEEALKLYSERLVRKLEQKMLQAEQEVAERRQTEEALRKSEEKYRSILDNIEDGYYEVDLKGNFMFFNHSMCRILGYMESELTGMNFRNYMDSKNAEAVFQTFNHVFKTGNTVKALDWELIKKDKTPCQLNTSVSLIRDMDGNAIGFRGIARDITEQKQVMADREKLQAQFLQSQKMESVGRLAGGVAHDFNNMLSVIIGYTELAIAKTHSSEPIHKDLKKILAAGRRSADMTRQLLAFARKQTIAPQVLDLNKTVEGMLKMLPRLIRENIDLAWLPKTGVWPVLMDPSQIDQILANLCVNARDAIADMGKIIIKTGMVTFDETYCADHPDAVPGDFVLLSVSDTGCGMDVHTRSNLFEPFFTTKEVNKGTGLGLATVYGIVRQNNGFINVYTEPGQGTTFKVYLPRHMDENENIIVKQDVSIPLSRGETILLVEDEADILDLTRTMLEQTGYLVLAADTPEKALQTARMHTGRPIDLLITDVIMPEMNGRDLAGHLKGHFPDIKLLFMSGYTANVIVHHGVLEKGVHFIEKPFSMIDFTLKVRQVLDETKAP